MASAYLVLRTYDYAKLKPRIERMVAEATGRRMKLNGEIDFDFSLSPAFVVTEAALANAPWASEPQMVTVRRIEAKVRLLPLLFGDVRLKYVRLDGVDVLLATNKSGQRNWEFTGPADSAVRIRVPGRIKFAVKDVRVQNLNLTYHDGQTGLTTRFNLAGLEVFRQADPDFLGLKLQADINGHPLELSGKIGRLERIIAGERFPLELKGQFSTASVSIQGAIGEIRKLRGIDLNVHVSGNNLQVLGRGIETKLPRTEAFDLKGHLAGSRQSLQLENISGNVSAGGSGLAVSGRVGDLIALQDLELQFKSSGKDLAQAGAMFAYKLPQTEEFVVQGNLTGLAGALSLQNVKGQARRGSLNLTAEGSIGDLLAFGGVDLNLKGSGEDLAEAGTIFKQKLPATDTFSLAARLTGDGSSLALHDIRGEARRGSLSLTAKGTIGDLLAFGHVTLNLKGSGRDLAEAEAIFGEKLPATDAFSLEGRLTGNGRTLALRDIRGAARRGALNVEAEGSIGNLPAFGRVDLWSKAVGKDLAQSGVIFGWDLPTTDEFLLEGLLTGAGRALSLRGIRGRARRGSLNLTAEGSIGDLLAFRRTDLMLKGSGQDLSQAGEIIGQQLPPTDEFVLQGRLTGSAAALSLQDVQGRARRGSMSLEANGSVNSLESLTGMDLSLKAKGKELAEIGPLVGATIPELGPFNISGHLRGSTRYFTLDDLAAVVDQSDLKGQAKVEMRIRPRITLVLESSLLDLTALMKNLGGDEPKGHEPASKSIESRLFSSAPLPLDIFSLVDADISLNAKNIRSRDANFEFGKLKLALENGDLSVDTLKATYRQARISGHFHLFPESPPRVDANFLVQDFDLGGLLRELRLSDEVQSHLDIAVDVSSRGASAHDLMAGLDGSVGAVMGEGYLTHYLDLLSMGLTRKVLHFWGHHKRGGEIKCAVVQFDINHGLAASRAFVFNTEDGVLTGEGDINLATEQVNFLLVPQPRYPSLMDFWTKLRVSGPITDPRVRPDTASVLSKAARALSALVIGPLGLLAPFVNLGAHKAHPCNVHSIGE
jgi:uncharacterized protein involved in outer membrane biogenesis